MVEDVRPVCDSVACGSRAGDKVACEREKGSQEVAEESSQETKAGMGIELGERNGQLAESG